MMIPENNVDSLFVGNKLRIKALALESIYAKKCETAKITSQ